MKQRIIDTRCKSSRENKFVDNVFTWIKNTKSVPETGTTVYAIMLDPDDEPLLFVNLEQINSFAKSVNTRFPEIKTLPYVEISNSEDGTLKIWGHWTSV